MRSHTRSSRTATSSIARWKSGAARSEPELADLLARPHDTRRRNLATLVDALRANGPLALPPAEALDTVWALTSPELHQLLVRVHNWSGGATRSGSPRRSRSFCCGPLDM
jgi:hypothetical protein